MKNIRKLLALLLCLALVLSLGAAAIFADEDGDTAVEETETAAEETEPSEETAEPAPAAEEAGTAEEAVICAAGEVRSAVSGRVVCEEGGVVFNNGATVYNNGGVVYNNFGTVYANAGTTYNNSGVMYVNGGRAFNNAGTVYFNPAPDETEPAPEEAESEGPEAEEAPAETAEAESAAEAPESEAAETARDGWPLTVRFAEDYSLLADWSGLRLDGEGTLLLDEDSTLILRPMDGYRIIEALSDSGSFSADEDGFWTLDGAETDFTVTLRVCPTAPEADLAPGVHAPGSALTLLAPAPAVIRYTLDGSEPGENSAKYTEPLVLDESCTLCARAYLEGLEPGELLTVAYTVPAVTVPAFDALTVGYAEDDISGVTVRIANTGDEEIRVLSVALAGEDASRFRLSTGEGGVIRPDETRDTHWSITPKPNLPAGEYTAELLLKLKGGESFSVPFSLLIQEA